MQLQENIRLAPYTTFKIGGPARFFVAATTHDELREALTFARAERLPTFLLGGGSNLLIADEGFPGVVIHLALTPGIQQQGGLVEVSAGTDWDTLVQHTCDQELYGIECLAGIPGLTGASPIQNIGAYGQEVAQTIEHIQALDLETLEPVTFSNQDCRFAYRTSTFNATRRNRFAITSVQFRLGHMPAPLTYDALRTRFGDTQPGPGKIAAAVREIRRGKGMLVLPGEPDSRSAGSFFKNPLVSHKLFARLAESTGRHPPNWPVDGHAVKLSAAWLIEQAGFHRGFRNGDAGISSRHTLALINRTGSATCASVLQLRDLIVDEVHARFNIQLEQEPVYLH